VCSGVALVDVVLKEDVNGGFLSVVVDADDDEIAGYRHSMLGSITCWQTLPLWSKARVNSMLCDAATNIKQKGRVGGSLVVHLASAVVEAVPGCVTPS